MKICRFCKQHIEKLELPKDEKADFLRYYDLYLEGDNSPAFTVMENDIVKGCAGIREINEKVGEAWFGFNHEFFRQHKKAIIAKTRDYIDFIGITFRLKSIQAVIDTNSKKDKRFIKFLGFRYEKKLENGWDIYSMELDNA